MVLDRQVVNPGNAQMHDRKFEIGDRVVLTALGRERSPKLKSTTGVIFGKSAGTKAYRVLFDGRTTPLQMHPSYIEAADCGASETGRPNFGEDGGCGSNP